jgi:hypothetical protein
MLNTAGAVPKPKQAMSMADWMALPLSADHASAL